MAKRSPILGYNHNVRYRGLVFHVQTEDSGVLSPHLFTHLFHGGVIVSTRKLVYDAGANEEAIKSLMQAQHKAVLKDLKKGSFDDKIDEYLGGTPGLEPRDATVATERPSEPTIEPTEPIAEQGEPTVATPMAAEPTVATPMAIEPPEPPPPPPRSTPAASSPELPIATLAELDPPTEPRAPTPPPTVPRAITSDRASPPSVRFRPSHEDAAAVQQIAPQTSVTFRTPRTITPQQARTSTPPLPRSPAPTPPVAQPTAPRPPSPMRPPSAPHVGMPSIAIADFASLGEDEPQHRARQPHDTELEMIPIGASDGVPRAAPNEPATPPPMPRSATNDRPALGAAALPPQRPISRPSSRPSVTPPAVVARPLVDAEGKPRHDTGAIEIYAPAPASTEPPPGERAERPGQYSVTRRSTAESVPLREKTGRIAVPAGLTRPGRSSSAPANKATSPPPLPRKEPTTPPPVARAEPPPPPRMTKPHGTVDPSGPPSRPTSPLPQARSSSSQPVVMSRPAVIVGAPAKPVAAPPQRVRKAREEDRGFGQGLISEKSLDEVILAYLSEDADDK